MGKFAKFIYYNVIVYILYMAVDTVFMFFHVYSSDKLGKDLLIMPTESDMMLILFNIIISTIGGYFILKKLEQYTSG
ncbi:hypothetical protein MNB_SV-10-113 [hydrothermal vent metagenome]|uniref:Uncharacterized protein n=1 Tax=hydrothermal vent metagenome TaxID=652676 RepID=A0A1W1BW06_9ZZZZ